MGKNKKNDPEKKAALLDRKAQKQNKAAQKRLQKETKTASGGSDETGKKEHQSLDDLLEAYRHKDIAGSKPIVEALKGYPAPRGNATLTLCEGEAKGKQDFYLFGGEFYDGIEMVVVDQLLRFDKNNDWKQIITPSAAPAPSPRCAHTTVYYNGGLYVFGGELATAENYLHYKDFWRYDIKKQTWRELTNRTGSVPSPRSGHAAIVWKSYMILFGGFYEPARGDTPRWFNDVYVFNLQTEQWMDVPHSKLRSQPEPRSACNYALIGDTMIIHGGYSKLLNSAAAGGKESKVHTDAWILNLKPVQEEKPPTWERLLSSTGGGAAAVNSRNPNGRCGCASASYKQLMLVFGGVVDSELMHHKMDSMFYSDLFAFDLDKRKWYPIKARKNKGQSTQQNDNEGMETVSKIEKESTEKLALENADTNDHEEQDEDDEFSSESEDEGGQQSGWDLDKLRSNMFAFYDANGNLVYEKIEEKSSKYTPSYEKANKEDSSDEEEEEKADSSDESEEEKEGEREITAKKLNSSDPPKSVKIGSSSVMVFNTKTNAPEARKLDAPLPRMNGE